MPRLYESFDSLVRELDQFILDNSPKGALGEDFTRALQDGALPISLEFGTDLPRELTCELLITAVPSDLFVTHSWLKGTNFVQYHFEFFVKYPSPPRDTVDYEVAANVREKSSEMIKFANQLREEFFGRMFLVKCI
jgi:hypothetical protein